MAALSHSIPSSSCNANFSIPIMKWFQKWAILKNPGFTDLNLNIGLSSIMRNLKNKKLTLIPHGASSKISLLWLKPIPLLVVELLEFWYNASIAKLS